MPLLAAPFFSACSATTTIDLLAQNSAGAPVVQAGALGTAQAGAAEGGSGSVQITEAGPRLLHRYDFSGLNTEVIDTISASNGEIRGGATLDGSGHLTLSGASPEYVKLPSWLISSLTSVSVVAWVTWGGGPPGQGVFSFGATNNGTPSDEVISQLFFTPMAQDGGGAAFYVETDHKADVVRSASPLPVNVPNMVAVVFDGERQELSLYVNRELASQPIPTTQRVTELKDANCWLGQSQRIHAPSRDDNFRGSYDEFRIYAGALSAEQIRGLSLTDPSLL